MQTPLFVKKGQGGMFAIINREITTGSIFWVDSNTGSDAAGYGSNPDAPCATIDYAIGLCTANKGDRIYVFAQHAETVPAAGIALDVAGVSIIGLMNGSQRPTLTQNAAAETIIVSAADCSIQNILFAAPGIDTVTCDISVTAANCSIINTCHIGSTTAMNKVNFISLAAGAHDCLIDGMRGYNTVVNMTGGGINLAGACARVEVRNCCILATAFGYDLGCIYDGATATDLYIHDCVLSNIGATLVTMEFGNNSTGVSMSNFVNGRHTTIQSNVTPGTGMAFYQTLGVEQAALNAIAIPVVDAE